MLINSLFSCDLKRFIYSYLDQTPAKKLHANTFPPNRGILKLMVGAAPPLNRLNMTFSLFVLHKEAQMTSEAVLSFVVFDSRPTWADLGAIGERAATSPFAVVTTMSVKDSD